MKSHTNGVMSIGVALLISMLATSLQAQGVRVPTVERSQELQRRSIMLDPTKNAAIKPLEKDQAKIRRQQLLALEQVKEDFTRIQVLANEMMRTISVGNALDYKRISDTTAEIRKRASRLKANLALPESEYEPKHQKDQDALDSGQVRKELLKLDDSIMSFVKSPHFRNPGVADAEHSFKAAGDLENIIELSSSIRKSAEKLSKELPRSHSNSPAPPRTQQNGGIHYRIPPHQRSLVADGLKDKLDSNLYRTTAEVADAVVVKVLTRNIRKGEGGRSADSRSRIEILRAEIRAAEVSYSKNSLVEHVENLSPELNVVLLFAEVKVLDQHHIRSVEAIGS